MTRSPFLSDFVALRDTLEQLVNQTPWSRAGNGTAPWPMPLDVYATDEAAVVLAAVPGMRPEDLELTVHQTTVTLAGTIGNVADAEEAKGATWFVHELASGAFRRSVTLPFPVDAERARAAFEHGVLRVTLPKAESAKPRKIAIGGQPEALAGGERAPGKPGAKQ
jgi:HSP20 family protein